VGAPNQNREKSVTSTTHDNYLPALGVHQLAEVGQGLQATLVELLDLVSIGKQLHWNVVRPHFRPLHLHLDELVASWRELADTIAERAVTLGFSPDGQSATVAADSGLAPIERGEVDGRVVVRELTRRSADIAERVRARMDRLGELDAVSQDALIEVVRALEQQVWMLRTQFEKAQLNLDC